MNRLPVRAQRLVVDQPLYRTALYQMFFHDLRHVVKGYHTVEDLFRVHHHDRPHGTQTKTPGLYHGDFLVESMLLQLFFQPCNDFHTLCRCTSRTSADQYMTSKHSIPPFPTVPRKPACTCSVPGRAPDAYLQLPLLFPHSF